MNFSVTTVFTPVERAELKKKFHQQKRLESQMNKVAAQATRSYKSTVEVKRVSRRNRACSDLTLEKPEKEEDGPPASECDSVQEEAVSPPHAR